ncbi:cell division protein ZapA [Novosphingobium sp. M1R2S20]|uniref:Cell division protein ZapA n=1 Tax=Novosphingobium rhizovicinum TaxID=3228928 RepID=A0ABV3RG62_9SPHN
MSNVHLSIGGRSYTVACADGEEEHVSSLGQMIDTKISANSGLKQQGEPRMLLFAALMLADELHEARSELEIARATPAKPGPVSAEIEDRVTRIAERVEILARHLEHSASNA